MILNVYREYLDEQFHLMNQLVDSKAPEPYAKTFNELKWHLTKVKIAICEFNETNIP